MYKYVTMEGALLLLLLSLATSAPACCTASFAVHPAKKLVPPSSSSSSVSQQAQRPTLIRSSSSSSSSSSRHHHHRLYQQTPVKGGESSNDPTATTGTKDNNNNNNKQNGEDTTTTTTSSDSYGSLLVRMKNNEEALLRKENMSLEDVEELDPIHKVTQPQKGKTRAKNKRDASIQKEAASEREEMMGQPPSRQQRSQTQRRSTTTTTTTPSDVGEQLLPGMDWETAKQLDDSVTRLSSTSPEELLQNVKVLPLSSLYASRSRPRTSLAEDATDLMPTTTTTTLPPLSRPEHYRDRIGRDRRHLAVSIAATTETEAQWRLFCQEQGGLYPILETIREGARALSRRTKDDAQQQQQQQSQQSQQSSWLDHHEEESVRAACRACLALRDLCAISPELAAVITDGMLRANAAWEDNDIGSGSGGGLLNDFCSILHHTSTATTEYTASTVVPGVLSSQRIVQRLRQRQDTRLRCKLYVTQLLLAMVVASDEAVEAIRGSPGLADAVLACSSYASKEQARRWLIRYPGEMIKWLWRRYKARRKSNNGNGQEAASAETQQQTPLRRPFMEAANLGSDLNGQVQRSANQILAAIGYNKWIPKNPGQRGLRILSLDGGGSRGMAAITAVNQLMEKVGNGADVADSFDMIVGTSTGGIIAFLVGLQRESSAKALERYKSLIKQIFIKSALSTPMMIFTTASYDEVYFMEILVRILKENSMLDSRADPAVPLVCALTSKMSSTPTHVALFRNYNYPAGEMPDPFTIDPEKAREDLDLPLEFENEVIRSAKYQRQKTQAASPGSKSGSGSRYPGSFRVLQRYALRASTAAPTFFKPVMMAGEMYCDGGIVASNPAAVAIHEARTLFPDIPIELVVSVGTGAFIEQKSAPRVGWDGILGQIVNSATDGEQVHHVLEDLLGEPAVLGRKKSAVAKTRYFRFNPVIGLPDEFPIDVTDPDKLRKLQTITIEYMAQPEQEEKVEQIADILKGRRGRRRKETIGH